MYSAICSIGGDGDIRSVTTLPSMCRWWILIVGSGGHKSESVFSSCAVHDYFSLVGFVSCGECV